MQQPEPLGQQAVVHGVDSGNVAAWPVERGERKHKSGTAIYATDGQVLAVGGALWIEPRG